MYLKRQDVSAMAVCCFFHEIYYGPREFKRDFLRASGGLGGEAPPTSPTYHNHPGYLLANPTVAGTGEAGANSCDRPLHMTRTPHMLVGHLKQWISLLIYDHPPCIFAGFHILEALVDLLQTISICN